MPRNEDGYMEDWAIEHMKGNEGVITRLPDTNGEMLLRRAIWSPGGPETYPLARKKKGRGWGHLI